MSKEFKPIHSGFAPDPKDLPLYKKKYQIKWGYYYLSGLVFVFAAVVFYVMWDLKQTGAYFEEIHLDSTIVTWYVVGLAIVSAGMRLRAGFCVLCGHFRFPTRLDINDYCGNCGAHLFRFHVFEQQDEEKSKHDLTIHERLLEMVKRGDGDAIRMLLYKGANVNMQDSFGNTPLITAAMTGRAELIDLLMQYRAKLDLCNNFGLDALMVAADKGQIEVARKLLEHGMSVSQKSSDGRDALTVARGHQNQEMIDLLEKAAVSE